MPTITLKDIPDDLYRRLEAQARAHRRSLDGEVIHYLDTMLRPRRISVEERLDRLQVLQSEIAQDAVGGEAIRHAIRDGRP